MMHFKALLFVFVCGALLLSSTVFVAADPEEGEAVEVEEAEGVSSEDINGAEEIPAVAEEEEDQISQQDMQRRLGVLFASIDADKDGIASPEEMVGWLTNIAPKIKTRYAQTELEHVDLDKDGKVSPEEFVKAHDVEGGDESDTETQQELTRRFETFDADKDGRLTKDEYLEYLAHPSDDQSIAADVEEILKGHDRNNDNKISLEEFKLAALDAQKQERGEEAASELTPSEEEELTAEFEEFDADSDGFIVEAELKAIVASQDTVEARLMESLTSEGSIRQTVEELLELAMGKYPEGERNVTKDKFIAEAEHFGLSALTDMGELLRYPEEYGLSEDLTTAISGNAMLRDNSEL